MSTPQPERHFLGWTESAALSVARWLGDRRESLASTVEGVLDFSAVLVVVPGAGARRQVLAALRKSIDGPMIPPEMTTPGKFVLSAFETPAGSCVAGPLDRLAAIARALAKSDSLRKFLVPAARGKSLAALARPARRLLDVIDRADDAHCSVDAIAGLDILQASHSMQEAWWQLAQLRMAMKAELAMMGRANGVAMLERSEVIDLAAKGWKPRCGALILAGLPDLARNVSFLSRELAGMQCNGAAVRVHALVLAPLSHESGFDDLGVVTGSGFVSGPELQDSMIEVAGDPSDQAAAAVARYSMLAGASDTGDTALVMADESLASSIGRAFAEHGRSVHTGRGIRFAETEVGKCLERIERAARGGDPGDFVELMRIPALSSWLSSSPGDFVQWMDEMRGELKPLSTAAFWKRLKSDAREHQKKLIEGINSELGSWLADISAEAGALKPLGERWSRLERWFAAMFVRRPPAAGMKASEANESKPADPWSEIQGRAMEEFAKTLQRARESAAAGELGTASDALSLALMLSSDLSVPDPGAASCVDTVGWLETLYEPARKFVLTGVFEGSLPSSPQADGWFNEQIRQRIGLPNRATRFARDAYLLSALAARTGPEKLAIVAGRTGGDGDPLKPSRLLLPADPVGVARRILLLTDQDAAPGRCRPETAQKTGGRSAFAEKPVPDAKIPDVMSVTDFSVYIENPYRYWLEKILRLNAPEPDSTELNSGEFGTLLHTAAQALVDPEIAALDATSEGFESRCLAHLEKVLRSAAAKQFGMPMRPSIQLQVLEISMRLPSLVDWHAGQVRAGWKVMATECGGRVAVDVDGKPQVITMRVDRVDFHPATGCWRIIDYKSSDGGYSIKDRVFRSGVWKDLQLALYKCLLPLVDSGKDELNGLRPATPDRIEVGVLAVPASNISCEWCPLKEDAASGLEEARRIIRCIRKGEFNDTGKDPRESFVRIRRALCLPMAERDEPEEAAEGATS